MKHDLYFRIDPPSIFQKDEPIYINVSFECEEPLNDDDYHHFRKAMAEDMKAELDQVVFVTEAEYRENTDEENVNTVNLFDDDEEV
jgi:hypothetical protein